VGTQSALLAGFAFTILSQTAFKQPAGGFLPHSTRVSLGMYSGSDEDEGIKGWDWPTWVQQISQALHLMLTTLGMCLQLWTVYACTVTNILGLGLALRGPEGSMDRAVRNMARQNHAALAKFSLGLIFFTLSIFAYAIADWYIYVSAPTCVMMTYICSKVHAAAHAAAAAAPASARALPRRHVPAVPATARVPAIAGVQPHPLARQHLLARTGAHSHRRLHRGRAGRGGPAGLLHSATDIAARADEAVDAQSSVPAPRAGDE